MNNVTGGAIMTSTRGICGGAVRYLLLSVSLCAAIAAVPLAAQQGSAQPTFATAEDAVRALTDVVKKGSLPDLLALFGPESRDLIDSADPATARSNREVFTVAIGEGWKLEDAGADRKVLVIGNEEWPFPVPIVKSGNSWRFDTPAGKEEVLARRIGRNELAVIDICRTYVGAQKRYAEQGHDGKPAGLFAKTFRSDPGKQNGLYWPAAKNEPRSPLGDLVAQAASEGRTVKASGEGPLPFHGYYFKILMAQGSAAPGGAKSYLVNGELSAGFALVAWPAQYDGSGIMTFMVNQDGVVREKDLGAKTSTAAAALTAYDPDASWSIVQ